MQIDILQSEGNTRLQSQTLNKRVLDYITKERGSTGYRQHVTMGESELRQYNRRQGEVGHNFASGTQTARSSMHGIAFLQKSFAAAGQTLVNPTYGFKGSFRRMGREGGIELI